MSHPEVSWLPGEPAPGRPAYRALADALARDIAAGRLRAGDRLPTQRALARALGVTVGTIARAYTEAESRGLISSEVGRGTFVRTGFGLAGAEHGAVDLASLHPPVSPGVEPAALLGAALAGLADDPVALLAVATTERSHDSPAHTEAAAAWVSHAGWQPEPGRVLLTSGAQHALTVTLLALAGAGGTVATTPLTNPGLIAAARRLSVPLVAVESDGHGMLPDALARACTAGPVALVHLQPTLANPTGRTMPADRREALAAVCERAGVWVLEDDPLGPLADTRPAPLAALLPGRTCHVASTAKVLTPGLRIGVLAAPREAHAELASAVRATTWLAPPLLGDILARWVRSGTAGVLTAARAEATRRRNTLARELLGGLGVDPDPSAPHLWLPLPEPWSAGQFAAAAREAGVLVSPGDEYTPSRTRSAFGVRVALNAGVDDETLRASLTTLRRLTTTTPPPEPLG
ncbi:PLP-dependent aminotransferase family protein [Streptomyces sp. NPDC101118]|uniref:aminotransferase-like domain-containing protein n=1 Tax=Streptomyces sp. NPDC101118 TaxID=3366109 RepID=UPI00381FED38